MTETNYVTYFISLFAVTNSLGNVAIFLGLTAGQDTAQQRKTGLITSFSVLLILLLSTWLGSELLKFFGISIPAFELAGGLVIILIGLSMLNAKLSRTSHTEEEQLAAQKRESVAVVPLALPIIAGPGAITAAIVSSQRYPHLIDKLVLSTVDIIITILIAAILWFAPLIKRILRETGIKIFSRIMGLILVAIAFDMIVAGCRAAFPGMV